MPRLKIHLSRILGERKMTQKDLHEKSGISQFIIGKLYHERNIERVSLETILKICKTLGIQDISKIVEIAPCNGNIGTHKEKTT